MTRFTTQRILFAAVLSAGLSTAAWAQVASETRDANRPATDTKMADGRMHDKKMGESRAYFTMLRESFGTIVRPLQRDQAASHDLKPGVGLVVEEVSPGSIAANSGLQKGDVIFKVGDQWTINADQLATLLSIQEANNGFEVKVHRGTERVDLDFKFDQAALDTMTRSLEPAYGAPDQRTDRSMDRSGKDREKSMDRNNPIIIPEKFDYRDDLHSINIRTEDGVKKLLVKDKDGNVLFDGPYNTLQEREAVPADIKAKVESVLREKVK